MIKSRSKKTFDISEFILKTKKEKKEYIISESKNINPPKFIVNYIIEIKGGNTEEIEEKIKKKINLFKDKFIKQTLPEKLKEIPTNLYQMSGANDFAKINLILRSLSTRMGHLWEDIAISSALAISTEKEFDIKINGVDIIFIKNKKPYYAQIKTLEGTLTGSQVSRSISELSMHKNSYFVSAFETGTSWTFNSDKIKRLLGKEFWSMIDLDYDFILEEVKSMIKDIEDIYKTKTIKN